MGGYGGVAARGINSSINRSRSQSRPSPGMATPIQKIPNANSMGGYGGVAARGINSAVQHREKLEKAARLQQQHSGGQRFPLAGRASGVRPPKASSPPKGIAAAAKAGPRMSMPTKIGLGVGAAAAVGVLMNRSGSPSDRGRQSIHRY